MKLKNQSVLSFIKDKKASSHNGDIHLYLRKHQQKSRKTFGGLPVFCYLCPMMEEKTKDSAILNLIRNTIRAEEPNAQIILYGSRARGDNHKGSDWDVLVIIDKPKAGLDDYRRLCYPVYYKGLDFGEEINASLYTRKEWESAPPSIFKHNVTHEGIYL